MADNVYSVQYASSGRAKCKDTKCLKGNKSIAKDELRIGKESPSPFGDGGDVLMTW
jgi:hypothetical protein